MFFRRTAISFACQRSQCPDNAETRVARFNHIVDKSIFGCLVRIGKLFAILSFLFGYKFCFFLGLSIFLSSLNINTSMAPCAPITAISADGQA